MTDEPDTGSGGPDTPTDGPGEPTDRLDTPSGEPGELDSAELLDALAELDEDNERLRNRVLELLELMEDAVTAQVAAERRADELAGRVAALEAELAAVADTRVMRLTRPVRAAYGRIRRRFGAAAGSGGRSGGGDA